MSRQITVFGIPNCDTVKKSRVWLQEQGLDFEFHDFKKQGLDRTTVQAWLQFVPLDILINRKGTTWRALSDAQKASAAEADSAIPLILSNPSLIKRPVLQMKNTDHISHVSVGFSADQFKTIFENK
ncbi:arsenate reductase [Undibacterium jejuense]|uniref:Arsenate reductase n=1 Tax=Undibacterium jejuense TaxID=1344949 RepID=A0A923HEH3_9BURK|nr:arsenate reductase [Undibacterium jejuense]MBC3860898.1 arsenate reductase [Undibacterium jejuense]